MDAAAPLPVYLDCDTGVDDALALAYLVASPGSADLLGVGTVSGNIDAATAARNTLDLLALLGRSDVPVAVGAHDRLTSSYDGGAARVHGDNGIGGVELPRAGADPVGEHAAEMLVRLARENPGRLHVVAIGPLTNLALALRAEPSLTTLVAGVTVMGGAALAPGNATPAAEANIAGDPEAAAEVLAAGWDVTLVPLDVTMDHLLDEDRVAEIAALDQPAMPAVAAMLEHYLGFYAGVVGHRAAALHDPLAVAVALGHVRLALAPTVRAVVDTTDGPGRGQTVCDMRGRYAGYPDVAGARCRVVLALEEPFAPLLVRTLRRFAPAPSAGDAGLALTVVGSINRDITAVGARLPGPGETVGGAVLHEQPGGKGANQAVAAARLLGRSRMIGAVGDDADGAAVLASMAAAGVDVSGVRRVGEPTGTALIAVDAGGENQIVVCTGANGHVSLEGVELGPDETVLCQLEVDVDVVLEASRRTKGFFALNAAPAKNLPAALVERCDLIIVNETEHAAIPALSAARLVAVTYGSGGSALLVRGEEVARVAGREVDVVSSVGAGDAYCAALVVALASGLGHEAALDLADAVGARAVGDASSQPELGPLSDYLEPRTRLQQEHAGALAEGEDSGEATVWDAVTAEGIDDEVDEG